MRHDRYATERRRLFQDLTQCLGLIKSAAALLLLQPLLPKEADNHHFGGLLAPLIDYFVAVENREEDREQHGLERGGFLWRHRERGRWRCVHAHDKRCRGRALQPAGVHDR